ncbi:MAG: hypothetical protein WC763_02515 [Candidatus Paceibacterota bacterium]|jgi:hypothetical protein
MNTALRPMSKAEEYLETAKILIQAPVIMFFFAVMFLIFGTPKIEDY